MNAGLAAGREKGRTMAIRRMVLALFLFSIIGTGVELLLLEHTEDFWQLIPLALMGASVPALLWFLAVPGRAVLRTFQVLMGFLVVSGLVGLYLHYRGNVEFELEMYPSLGGFGLFWEAIRGATPTLAPGTMIALGLLGLLFAYRHPALNWPDRTSTDTNVE